MREHKFRLEESTADSAHLYDAGDDVEQRPKQGGSHTARRGEMALYDAGDDEELEASPTIAENVGEDGSAGKNAIGLSQGSANATRVDKVDTNGVVDDKLEAQLLYGNIDSGVSQADSNESDKEHSQLCTSDIGSRVHVQGYDCLGTLAFVGAHAQKGAPRAGVILDEPVGRNNGTVDGVQYFSCASRHGILCVPSKVSLVSWND